MDKKRSNIWDSLVTSLEPFVDDRFVWNLLTLEAGASIFMAWAEDRFC